MKIPLLWPWVTLCFQKGIVLCCIPKHHGAWDFFNKNFNLKNNSPKQDIKSKRITVISSGFFKPSFPTGFFKPRFPHQFFKITISQKRTKQAFNDLYQRKKQIFPRKGKVPKLNPINQERGKRAQT